jgi:Protein of unknown function (DUF4038)/Putative collagen-binding domain of a collagenase
MTQALRAIQRASFLRRYDSFLFAASLMVNCMVTGWPVGATAADETSVVAASGDRMAAFPLSVKVGQRYLEDADGKPFLIQGDTAWSLIADLTREDAERYLEDRRERGFNTILVSLIEHRFATNAPANAYGARPFHSGPFEMLASLDDLVPFLTFADYSRPNEEYFDHADWVLRRAAEKGLLVLLTPSYVGYGGGIEGWHDAMVANGPDRLRAYGQYLGRRYRDFENILWVHAGDSNPPDKDLVRAIAEGIQETDPQALHTAHGAPETAVLDYWQDEPWFHVNNVYTYGPVHAPAMEQYKRPERLPYFLIESAYENEHGADERRLRTQAYQAMLSGAAGQVFGNNPIWHFDGPALYPAPVTWQEALASPGAQSMTHLRNLLTNLPWWLLEPDVDNAFLTGGLGSVDDRAVAARTVDRRLAVVYLPSNREVTIDLDEFAGPQVSARWYDPAGGGVTDAPGSPFPTSGSRRLRPHASANSSGHDDWVLILESPS